MSDFTWSIFDMLRALTLIATMASCNGICNEYDCRPLVTETRIEELMRSRSAQLQLDAVTAYGLLMEAFTTEDGIVVFPDDYAGAYLYYNTLVIQLTDISVENLEFYNQLFGQDSPISFKHAGYSINQLSTLGDKFVYSLDLKGARIVSYGVDILSNTFSITLDRNEYTSVQIVNEFNEEQRLLPIPVTIELGGGAFHWI